MKAITLFVSDETLRMIQQSGSKKLRGRVWLEEKNGKQQICYEPYRQTANHRMHVLHLAPFGCLSDTKNHVKLVLSIPKRVGLHRAANLLLSDAKESSDVLHQLADNQTNTTTLSADNNVEN